MRVEFFGVEDGRMRDALAIRLEVFVREQQVPAEIEIDERDESDATAVHAIVYGEADKPVAAGRFYELDESAVQIGRMAVLKNARGLGAGRFLLAALMKEAERRGYTEARLHAQTHARGFYEKAGFVAFGEEFDDAGILHIEMKRRLS